MFTNISLRRVRIENLAAGNNCYETLPSFCVTLLSTVGGIVLSTKCANI
jgi:hypothetical protein